MDKIENIDLINTIKVLIKMIDERDETIKDLRKKLCDYIRKDVE